MDGPFVIGFDGSPAATAAVRFTTRLAAAEGAPVVVAHAFAPGHDIADARAASDELLAQVGEPSARLRSIAAHSVADGLRDLARFEDAALLAVGRTHHGPVGRALADGVPAQLLHHGHCPLLIVPSLEQSSAVRPAIGVIGVAFDGGAESHAALGIAEELAPGVGARIVLLGVAEPPAFVGTGEVAASRPTLDHEVRETYAEMQRAIEEAGHGSLECRALHGPVGPTLVAACNDGIDLLVAGSRGRGPLATVIAGSVSRHLALHAPCPVLVVPRGVSRLPGGGRHTVGAA